MLHDSRLTEIMPPPDSTGIRLHSHTARLAHLLFLPIPYLPLCPYGPVALAAHHLSRRSVLDRFHCLRVSLHCVPPLVLGRGRGSGRGFSHPALAETLVQGRSRFR